MGEYTDTERLDALEGAMRAGRMYADDAVPGVSMYPEGDDVDGDEKSFDSLRAAADALLAAR